MEPRPTQRIVSPDDLLVAQRVADYYAGLKVRNVHEPALSTCTVAFQQAITRMPAGAVTLVIGDEAKTA